MNKYSNIKAFRDENKTTESAVWHDDDPAHAMEAIQDLHVQQLLLP